MTKILYVPSGLYLSFIFVDKDTRKSGSSVVIEDTMWKGKLEELINVIIEAAASEGNKLWSETNYIQFPVVREDFEIIYD